MARGQGSPSAVEFVLGPLRISFPIIFIKDNPIITVLAQPAACLDFEDRFLSTRNKVKGKPILSYQEISPFLGQAALAMGFPRDGAVTGVATQPDPLVTAGAEDSVSLELSNIWISSEEIDAFLLRPLRPTFLSLGLDHRCADRGRRREGRGLPRLG